MTNRFHHLQMKWSEHILKNFWVRRVHTRSEFSEGHVPAEVRFALSWVLGRDVLDCTDLDVCHLLSRAFTLENVDGTFLIHQRAPFCIADFLNLTYFQPSPLIKNPPLSVEECERLGIYRPKTLRTEGDRADFQKIFCKC